MLLLFVYIAKIEIKNKSAIYTCGFNTILTQIYDFRP
nr:MAG TPA: hypothetical protein [Caudoviricetes sp.]